LSRCDNSARVQWAARGAHDWTKPLASSLRRWTRRYWSQRDQFHLAAFAVAKGGGRWSDAPREPGGSLAA